MINDNRLRCHLILAGSEHVDDSLLKSGGKFGLVETEDVVSSRQQEHDTPESRNDHLRLDVTSHCSSTQRI